MIQFNLLPDVKIEYVKAQRTKRMVIGTATIATAVTFTVFVLLFATVHGVQKKLVSNMDKKIASSTQELKDTPNLNKILTIQNQLGSLSSLHDQKAVTPRVFDYLQRTTPIDITISEYEVDFSANTMKITGLAPTLDRVNTFSDTLKFSKFAKSDDPANQIKAFSDVVLTEFSRTTAGSTYTIGLKYDPALFNSAAEIALIVPRTVTTRSVIEQPIDLFKKNPEITPETTTNTSTSTN